MSSPVQNVSVEEAERLRVEIEKLRLEVADLRRWRAKAVIAVASAFLAPLISIAIFVMASSASRTDERRRAADSLYSKVVQDFASPTLARRLSAVSAMSAFTSKQDAAWWVLRSKAEQAATEERARSAVSLLVNSLDSEADPTAANAIVKAIATRTDLSLPLVLDANRRAAAQFARAAGNYSGLWMLHDANRPYMDDGQVPADLKIKVEDGLEKQIIRSSQLFDTADDANSVLLANRFLYGQPYRNLYQRQQRYARRDSTHDVSTVPTEGELGRARAALLQKALFLEATSRALTSALKSTREDSQLNKDWHGVAIVCGGFPDPADFADFDLHGAYLFATTSLSRANFKNADLSDADLTGFHFRDGELAGARYQGMKLCSDWSSFAPGIAIDSQKILWVDSQASRQHEVDPRCPLARPPSGR